MIEQTEVVVIGAGIAGLTAAYQLGKADDFDVIVLEKEDRVGGRTVRGEHDGFVYARGTEYLGEPEGLLKQLIRKLDLQLREIPSPCDAHWHGGQFYYGEDGIAAMYIEQSSLSDYNRFVQTIQKQADAYVEANEFKPNGKLADLDRMTAREFFQQNGFGDIYQQNFNVAARGLFGASIDEISALSFIPEIAFDYYDTEPISETRAARLNRDRPRRGSEETGTFSFTGGIAEVTLALQNELGHAVRLQSTVTSVQRDGKEFITTYRDARGNLRKVRSLMVVLAVPAPIAAQIAENELTAEQRNLMNRIEYAGYVTISFYTREIVWDGAFDLAVEDGHFFTDVYDATWIQRQYDSSVRNRNDSIFTVYIAPRSYKDRSVLNMSDQALLESSMADLKKIFGANIETKITGQTVLRFPYAYPVMTPGAYARLRQLNDLNARNDGLFLAGDYMIYPTFEAAVDSGGLAAELAQEYYDETYED